MVVGRLSLDSLVILSMVVVMMMMIVVAGYCILHRGNDKPNHYKASQPPASEPISRKGKRAPLPFGIDMAVVVGMVTYLFIIFSSFKTYTCLLESSILSSPSWPSNTPSLPHPFWTLDSHATCILFSHFGSAFCCGSNYHL